jgi:hypothetical protein
LFSPKESHLRAKGESWAQHKATLQLAELRTAYTPGAFQFSSYDNWWYFVRITFLGGAASEAWQSERND